MENKYEGLKFKIARITDKDGVDKTEGVHGDSLNEIVNVDLLVIGRGGYLDYINKPRLYLHTSTVVGINEVISVFTDELVELQVTTRNTVYFLVKI